MRWFILFAFLGAFLIRNVNSSVFHKYPSNLRWLFGLSDKSNDSKEKILCQTDECKQIAKILLNSMNKSVDPCDDFYDYACGQWAENNPIPKGESEWSLFNILQEKVEMQMKDILKEGSKKDDVLAVKLAKKWYTTCMNTDAMDKQGLDPLISTLSRIGGWPIIMDPDEWNEEEYSWQKVDNQYARLIGRNAFHDVRVYYDGPNRADVIVHVDTPHLPPGSYRIWNIFSDNSLESYESDEDPSDEDKQNDEDTLDPEGEDEDDSNIDEGSGWHRDGSGDYDDDDDDDDDDGDDDDDDDDDGDDDDKTEENSDFSYNDSDNEIDTSNDDDYINKRDNNRDAKKKKPIGKLNHKNKNKKSTHNKKKRSHIQIVKKRNNHKEKKHRLKRVKRHVIMTKGHSKHTSHSVHRNKINGRKIRKHKKILHNMKTVHTEEILFTTSLPIMSLPSTEEPDEDDEMILQKYADYISKVARALARERGIEIPEEQIENDVENMMEFHIKLTDIVMESGKDLNVTLRKFQKWYDKKYPENDNSRINWVYKITDLFGEAGVNVDESLRIEVGSPDYFEGLVSLLDETPSRTIVNYIHWNFLSRMIITTTNEMRKLYNIWEDDEEEEDRQSKCIQEAEMSDILSYEYVRKHFSDEISKTGMNMLDDIQTEVEYLIKESDWMDADTKNFILAKLMNMKKFVGYPSWYRNTTIVKRYFQGLIMGNSYYENTLSYKRYYRWQQLRRLQEEEDTEDNEVWWINPVTVNAIFDPEENSIAITAADFQSPFFSYNRPQAINFGILGFIMAHEVNHGFDDTGHLYDKNGNFMEWLSAMANAYDKKALCFVEQFNDYPVEKESNKKLKNYGNQTAGENIADTMGLQAVFKAYRRREKECGKPNNVLPGLEEFTNDQLFFLSFANTWCEAAVDPETAISTAKIDSHSIGRLRVIGSVSNSEDFAKTYNCPVGSPMNPEYKCNIWK